MKKITLVCLAALLSAAAFAQPIRTNYRSGGITHISTGYEALNIGNIPAEARVELAGFPDGSLLYLLYVNLYQKTATVVPKGVKMAVTLGNGKLVRLEQIGQDSATKRRLDNGLFVNRLKYAVEVADMEKMVQGVRSVDIITGWEPDDYIQAAFAGNELGALLKRHCEAILKASGQTLELETALGGYTENQNSVMSSADPVVARGERCDYNVLLSHLYYKNTNQEDVDLAFAIGTQERFHVYRDAPVRFVLRDGTAVDLVQTRDDVNFVCVYPELEQLMRMASEGVESISVTYEGGVLEDCFPLSEEKNGFGDAVAQGLQLLLSLSAR